MNRQLHRYIFTIILLAMAWACAYAQSGPSVNVSHQPRVIQGKNFALTFVVKNGNANAPKAPELKGCTLLYGPAQSTMQTFSNYNGRMVSESTIEYTYTYRADNAGTVNIPSVGITVDGKALKTKPSTLTIVASQDAGKGSSDVRVDDIRTQKPGEVSPNDLMVKVLLSKSSVYEQEALVATVKVYTKYSILDFRATVLPTFEGFLSEELEVTGKPEYENINGQVYLVGTLKRCLLFPQKSGKLTINSGKYDITVEQFETISNGFFTTQRPVQKHLTTSSSSVSLDVKALPQPAPASFNGAVGNFTVTTNLNPLQLKTNEAASLNLSIAGTGNIKYLKAPTIDLPSGIDLYTPQTDIDARFNGNTFTGKYNITYTLVPQEPGDYKIEPGEFSWFDLETKTYKTIDLPSYDIKVAKGASVASGVEQKSIESSMTDILHIRPSQNQEQTLEVSYLYHNPIYWLIYFTLAMLLIVVILVYRRRIKLRADVTGRKLARANRVANKRLKTAHKFMREHRNLEFYTELTRALWGYLSDKLNIQSSQLLRENVADKLTEYGANDSDIQEIIAIIDDCEMARYTPEHSENELSDLYNRATKVIKNIEDIKK